MKKHTEKKTTIKKTMERKPFSKEKKNLFQNPLLKENLTVNRKTLFIKKNPQKKKHFEKKIHSK